MSQQNCQGEAMITLGTAIAFQIAREQPPQSLAALGALFNVIGDQLSLLSVTKASSTDKPACPLPNDAARSPS